MSDTIYLAYCMLSFNYGNYLESNQVILKYSETLDYLYSHFNSSRAVMLSTMNWKQESLSCCALYMVANSSSSAAFFRVTVKEPRT